MQDFEIPISESPKDQQNPFATLQITPLIESEVRQEIRKYTDRCADLQNQIEKLHTCKWEDDRIDPQVVKLEKLVDSAGQKEDISELAQASIEHRKEYLLVRDELERLESDDSTSESKLLTLLNEYKQSINELLALEAMLIEYLQSFQGRFRKIALSTHPDAGGQTDQVRFVAAQQAFKMLDAATPDEREKLTYDLVFGQDTTFWSAEQREVVRPFIGELALLFGDELPAPVDSESCETCHRSGHLLVREEKYAYPVPGICPDCDGCGIETDDAMQYGQPATQEDSSSSSTQEPSAIALAPPQHFAEALLRYMSDTPERHTKQYLAHLRAQCILLINQSIEQIGMTTTAAKQDNIQQVMDDGCLGVSYVEREKGIQKVREIIDNHDISIFVRIGRQLREEQVLDPILAVRKQTHLGIVSPDGISALKYSTVHYEEIKEVEKRAHCTHVGSLHIAKQEVKEDNKYIAFAESIGVTPDACKEAYEQDGIKPFFDRIAGTYMGCLEAAVFVRVFCNRFGVEPEGNFVIPRQLLPKFIESCKRLRKKTIGDNPNKEHQVYLRACDEIFDNNPQARTLLERALWIFPGMSKPSSILPPALSHLEDVAPTENWNSIFPNPETLPEYDSTPKMEGGRSEEEAITLRFALREPRESDSTLTPVTVPFSLSSSALASSTPEELLHVLDQFPRVGQWKPILLEDRDSAALATIINKLYSTESVVGIRHALQLFICIVSLEPQVYQTNCTVSKLFSPPTPIGEKVPREAFYKQLKQQGSWIVEVVEQVDPKFLSEFLGIFCSRRYDDMSTVSVAETVCNTGNHMHDLVNWHPSYGDAPKYKDPSQIAQRMLGAQKQDVPSILEEALSIGALTASEDVYVFLLELGEDFRVDSSLQEIIVGRIPLELLAHSCAALITCHLSQDPFEINSYERPYSSTHKYSVQWAMSDSAQRSSSKESEKKAGETIRGGNLVFRMNVFLDAEGNFSPPEEWGEIHKLFDVLPDDLKDRISAICREHSDDCTCAIFPFIFRGEEDRTILTFSNYHNLSSEDVDLIKHISAGEDPHGISHIIARKALNVGRSKQIALLEAMQPSDAAQVACILLGEAAQEKRDESTVASLDAESWGKKSRGFLPSTYSFMNGLLRDQPAHREALSQMLQEMPAETPLAELSHRLTEMYQKKSDFAEV